MVKSYLMLGVEERALMPAEIDNSQCAVEVKVTMSSSG